MVREVIPFVLLSLVILTGIIFTREASRFTELLIVSSRKGLPMDALWQLMAALVPGIMVFTLPISLLVGTLVGLGRMSGDSEIIAMLASGISRAQILKPISILGLVTVVLMGYITTTLLPGSISSLANIKDNQSLVFHGLNAPIKPRVFEESVPKKVL
jgi:lipopolysaccharide export LptBFGC system permease protein LptF